MNMGETEAIAESYYSVMNTHRNDGGQHNDTLDMRTLIDWCLPPVLKCPKTISEVATMFRTGDTNENVSRHRSPIFSDGLGRASVKYSISKVWINN